MNHFKFETSEKYFVLWLKGLFFFFLFFKAREKFSTARIHYIYNWHEDRVQAFLCMSVFLI